MGPHICLSEDPSLNVDPSFETAYYISLDACFFFFSFQKYVQVYKVFFLTHSCNAHGLLRECRCDCGWMCTVVFKLGCCMRKKPLPLLPRFKTHKSFHQVQAEYARKNFLICFRDPLKVDLSNPMCSFVN